ncbi:hypothetical protein FRX31_009967 [Thalictrum thalictroides]|uniref:CLAVATA3/ESR (CLE)-related protein n=1 Tax=Thalictrum thalictroides TaxID=46969 RepID=A0A7J6WSW7_THATH|nr:hypothetical protein FRX31_009967 [Thalictrum thalictroides]
MRMFLGFSLFLASTLVLLTISPAVKGHHTRGYEFDVVKHDRTPVLLLKYAQIHYLQQRRLQQASSPSDNEDKNDNTLVQPAGGGHSGTGNDKHHGTDLKSWDKQHPRPPP